MSSKSWKCLKNAPDSATFNHIFPVASVPHDLPRLSAQTPYLRNAFPLENNGTDSLSCLLPFCSTTHPGPAHQPPSALSPGEPISFCPTPLARLPLLLVFVRLRTSNP